MTGLGSLLSSVALILSLGLTYAFGMTGWSIGTGLMIVTLLVSGFLGLSELATLAVHALAGGTAAIIALRWSLRHTAWQTRILKDRSETEQRQQQMTGAVSLLREKINSKAAEVDRGLKQYELIRRLAEAMSWEEMSPSLDKAVKAFFHAEGWALYLTEENGDLSLVQRRGAAPEPRAEDLPKKDPYLHTFVVSNGNDNGRTSWAICMPLWRLHERIGLLILRLPEGTPDQQLMLADAGSFAVNLIFAMAKAKLYRDLDRRSRTDGLTGLSRRGPFEERLREEVARATSFRTTFSILMIDIDHFKHLNDTYGHQVGDEVLKTVSARLREGLYETDVIARYGGEEFVCLLPRSDPNGLLMKADQLRARVADQAFIIGVEAIQVTISLGIAHFPRDGASAEAVMAAADRALYAAKAAGRNRVTEARRMAA